MIENTAGDGADRRPEGSATSGARPRDPAPGAAAGVPAGAGQDPETVARAGAAPGVKAEPGGGGAGRAAPGHRGGTEDGTGAGSGIEAVMAAMAERLTDVRGVRVVVLGGSRARGTHRPDSDWDLGLYYRGEPDLAALADLAAEFTGEPVEVAGPGGWGPWVDGGAWLRVGGVPVDWILRDLDRVERVWADCREGRYEVGVQPGHPLGFWSPVYAGEVALGRVLSDPHAELGTLREQTATYPPALRAALVEAAWEADFVVAAARKDAGDPLYTSLCVSRALGILTQSLHAHHRAWLLNEKGALASAARLPTAPADFTARVGRALSGPGTEALDAAEELVAEVRARL